MTYSTVREITCHQEQGLPFAFEKSKTTISIIESDRQFYLRVLRECCSAESNGRPVSTIDDVCYPIDDPDSVNEANWKSFARFEKKLVIRHLCFEGIS